MTSSEEVKVKTHSMLSGVPVREHGRSIRPPLSARTHTTMTFSLFYMDYMTSLTEAPCLRKVKLSPAAIWILQPDSSWILVICSPPLPITGERREKRMVPTTEAESQGACWFQNLTGLDSRIQVQ